MHLQFAKLSPIALFFLFPNPRHFGVHGRVERFSSFQPCISHTPLRNSSKTVRNRVPYIKAEPRRIKKAGEAIETASPSPSGPWHARIHTKLGKSHLWERAGSGCIREGLDCCLLRARATMPLGLTLPYRAPSPRPCVVRRRRASVRTKRGGGPFGETEPRIPCVRYLLRWAKRARARICVRLISSLYDICNDGARCEVIACSCLPCMVSAERCDTHCAGRAVPAWSACWSRLYAVPPECDAYLSQRSGLCVALSKQLE